MNNWSRTKKVTYCEQVQYKQPLASGLISESEIICFCFLYLVCCVGLSVQCSLQCN